MANRTVTVTIAAQDSFSSVMSKYNRAMGEADTNTKKAASSANEAKTGFAGMGTAIGGMVAALGVQQVIQFAEGFNQLGVTVHANRVLFDTLTESIGGNTAVLQQLRDATGGVVTDLDLMAGSSQLLRLNIVDNADDLALLTEQIQKLKSPTESTTDAIQNFALMLSNESLLRLDSFGISSANVKRRMDELGMSFREATMAEMASAVDRLGAAGDIAETAFAKLQIRFENFWNSAAERFAMGAEATANLISVLIDSAQGNLPSQIAEQNELSAQRMRGSMLAESFFAGYSDELEDRVGRDYLATFINRLNADIENAIAEGGELSPAMVSPDRLQALIREITQLPTFELGTSTGSGEFIDAANFTFMQAQRRESQEEAVRLEQARLDIMTLEAQATADIMRNIQAQADEVQRMGTMTNAEALRDQLGAMLDDGTLNQQNFQGITLFTEEQGQIAANMLADVQSMVELAQEQHELGIIDDAELARVKELATEAGEFASEIQKGADAFNSMNLAQLLGQGGGGVLGELTDRLEGRMREAGLAPDQIQAFLDQANLASGRETAFSQGLDPFLDTIIELPPTEQITAMQRLYDSMMQFQLQGGDPNSIAPGDIGGLAGFGPDGMMLPDFDPEGVVAKLLGDDGMKALLEDSASTAIEVERMETAGVGLAEAIDDAGRTLDGISQRTYTLRFDVKGLPQWLQDALALNNGLLGAMENTTRANGGIPPGSGRGGGAPGARQIEE